MESLVENFHKYKNYEKTTPFAFNPLPNPAAREAAQASRYAGRERG
jgi:hypothetical protein